MSRAKITVSNDKIEFVIVGMNSIGRSLVGMLAALGTESITLVDDKIVSAGAKSQEQGFGDLDLGMPKTQAVMEAMSEAFYNIKFSQHKLLDEELIQKLSSKIKGNTVLVCCEPMTLGTKQHLCKFLENSCKEIYFTGFTQEGLGNVLKYTCGSHADCGSELDQVSYGKEVANIGRTIAAHVFASIVNSWVAPPELAIN
jgi:hypothetical protein